MRVIEINIFTYGLRIVLFGVGIQFLYSDTPPLFSERNGLRKTIRIGNFKAFAVKD